MLGQLLQSLPVGRLQLAQHEEIWVARTAIAHRWHPAPMALHLT